MVRYHRWIFESNATKDEFLRQLVRALARRGLAVGPAKLFDASVHGLGSRGWVKVLHHAQGLDLVLKEKPSLGSRGLDAAVLEAGREAQGRLLRGEPASEEPA